MAERRSQPCPATRVCCPVCHAPVPYAELEADGGAFFLCQRRPAGSVPCNTHFYAACSDFYCVTTEVTKAEREHMRTLPSRDERLAYLAARVAWPEGESVAKAA
jgi:hypothetical protein